MASNPRNSNFTSITGPTPRSEDKKVCKFRKPNVNSVISAANADSDDVTTVKSIIHQYIQFGKKQGEMSLRNDLIRTIRDKLDTDRFDNKRLELDLFGTSTAVHVIEGALK
jgi:hypothetical protein